MGYSKWSPDDRRRVVDNVHALTIKHNYTVPYQKGVLLGLVREAQLALPKSRQREIATTASVLWVEEAVMEKMTRPPAPHEGSPDKIIATIEPEVIAEKLRNSQSVWELIKAEVRKTPIIETLVESVAEQVVDEIQSRITAKLLGRGITVGSNPTPEPAVKKTPVTQKSVVKAPNPPAVKKDNKKPVKLHSLKQLGQIAGEIKTAPAIQRRDLKTIVVCGLYAEQAEILKREFMGKAIVHVPFVEHFAEHDVAKNADVVFLITAKINHSNEEYMRAFVPKERFKYVSGTGLSAVKRDIYRYLESQPQPT